MCRGEACRLCLLYQRWKHRVKRKYCKCVCSYWNRYWNSRNVTTSRSYCRKLLLYKYVLLRLYNLKSLLAANLCYFSVAKRQKRLQGKASSPHVLCRPILLIPTSFWWFILWSESQLSVSEGLRHPRPMAFVFWMGFFLKNALWVMQLMLEVVINILIAGVSVFPA